MKMFPLLAMIALIPTFASAADQGSVSFACGRDRIVEMNLEGFTFFPQQLAAQGYSVSVEQGALHLVRGSESILLGSLQNAGACDYAAGMRTSFVDFTNLDLSIDSKVERLSGCTEVTTDGIYGIAEHATIRLTALDSGATFVLTQTVTQNYDGLDRCQAALR